jgi:hypothetical protein
MNIFKKIADIWEAFTVKISLPIRIGIGALLAIFVIGGIIGGINHNNIDRDIDPNLESKQNVYLYEEVIFADEIYLKCVGINAKLIDGTYELNLVVRIEQWNTDININKQKISSEMFSLKQVDINAPSNMDVFLNKIVMATIAAGVDAMTGEVNVLESTVGFVADYIEGTIENASTKKGKTIKAGKEQFEPFYPYQQNGQSQDVKLTFQIPQEIYESHYTLVLSIDSWRRIEKNIFLTLRPNTNSYNIKFDLNGGVSEDTVENITCQPAEIPSLPEFIPTKVNYQFLYWTSEKNNKSTKIRDLYFYSYDEGTTFTVYAYYQECLNIKDVVNINEDIYFKDNTYIVSVDSIEYIDSFVIRNKAGNDIAYTPKENTTLILLKVTIVKTKKGNNHTLDNKDDFYLENDYIGMKVESYYGYIKGFKSTKPVDDYNWIGLKLSEADTYTFSLLFEIDDYIDLNTNMLFLEIDFFATEKAKSIFLR